jgi:hypothetical protein
LSGFNCISDFRSDLTPDFCWSDREEEFIKLQIQI